MFASSSNRGACPGREKRTIASILPKSGDWLPRGNGVPGDHLPDTADSTIGESDLAVPGLKDSEV
jgi:hypothetical protein